MSKGIAYIEAVRARKWKHNFYVREWPRRDQIEWLQDQDVPQLWKVKGVRIIITDDKLALAFKLRWM